VDGACGVKDGSLLENTGGVVSCAASYNTIEFDPYELSLCHSVSRP